MTVPKALRASAGGVVCATLSAEAAAQPASAPYSLPWQLRPVIAPRVVRAETSIARYEDAAGNGGTFALGPRAHVKLGPVWLRPGVSYQRALDKPLAASTPSYHIVQLDVPVLF